MPPFIDLSADFSWESVARLTIRAEVFWLPKALADSREHNPDSSGFIIDIHRDDGILNLTLGRSTRCNSSKNQISVNQICWYDHSEILHKPSQVPTA